MNDQKTASAAEMDALHAELAKTMTKMVKLIKTEAQKAESAEELKGAAATLNVVRQFLKDNNITSLDTPDSPLQSLTDSLPFTTDSRPSH